MNSLTNPEIGYDIAWLEEIKIFKKSQQNREQILFKKKKTRKKKYNSHLKIVNLTLYSGWLWKYITCINSGNQKSFTNLSSFRTLTIYYHSVGVYDWEMYNFYSQKSRNQIECTGMQNFRENVTHYHKWHPAFPNPIPA